MVTIVRVKSTGEKGILVGTGFGAFKAARPSLLFGNLAPTEQAGELPTAAIADAKGSIRWAYTDDVEVLTVDGVSPRQALA